MKLMASGVTNWAATVRSPSFSRSSSSTTTSMRPARISSIASAMVANRMVSFRIPWPARDLLRVQVPRVKVRDDQEEGCQDPVENNWYRPAQPSLVGVEAHADHISDQHRAQID